MLHRIAVFGMQDAGREAVLHSFETDTKAYEPKIYVNRSATKSMFDKKIAETQFKITLSDSQDDSKKENANSASGVNEPNVTFSLMDISDTAFWTEDTAQPPPDLSRTALYLKEAEAWVIVLDGSCFQRIALAKQRIRKYARTLMPAIPEYAAEPSDVIPEIIFMITKANEYLGSYMNVEGHKEVSALIKDAFGGFIPEDTEPRILLSDINVKTALLTVFSIVYQLHDRKYQNDREELREKNKKAEADITQSQREIDIASKKMISDSKSIEQLNANIISLKAEIKNNTKKLEDTEREPILEQMSLAIDRLLAVYNAMLVSGFHKELYTCKQPVDENGREKVEMHYQLIPYAVCLIAALVFALTGNGASWLLLLAGLGVFGLLLLALSFVSMKLMTIFLVLGVLGFVFETLPGILPYLSFGRILGAVVLFFIGCICVTPICKKVEPLDKKYWEKQRSQALEFYDKAARKGE